MQIIINKCFKIFIFLLLFPTFYIYAQQHEAESNFKAIPIEGKSVEITEYIGNNWDVSIPPLFRRLPVTHIGNNAFRNKNLVSITIPEGVIQIGDRAFYNNQLTNIRIPDSVKTIGYGVFYGNFLTNVIIGNGITRIGVDSFNDNKLTSITIGNSVTVIGHGAFGSNQLTSITIPDSVKEIGWFAFTDNQLTSIIIGANVSMETGDTPSFDNNFQDFYIRNGRKEGTYTYNKGEWSLKPR